MSKPIMKLVTWHLVAAMFLLGIVPKLEAGLAPSEITNSAFSRDQDVARVQKVLESKMIQERLGKLGYTAEEVKMRLTRLNDEQLHRLALHLDDLKMAGDDGLGIVIALLVIAILVVVLLELTGHRVIVR